MSRLLLQFVDSLLPTSTTLTGTNTGSQGEPAEFPEQAEVPPVLIAAKVQEREQEAAALRAPEVQVAAAMGPGAAVGPEAEQVAAEQVVEQLVVEELVVVEELAVKARRAWSR